MSRPPQPSILSWRFVAANDLDLSVPPPLTGLDAAAWATVLEHSGVWVDGRPGCTRAPAGSRVECYAFAAPPPPLELPRGAVLLDADGVVAVDKPAGLSTQRTRVSAHRNLEVLLRALLGDPALRAVHRLDQDTSGVVLFARDRATTARLQGDLESGRADKRYLAVVAPPPRERDFSVSGRLVRLLRPPPGRDYPVERPLLFALTDDPAGRPSETHFTRLAVDQGRALLLARPVTGRTHQLRVHLQSRLHPILGDALYGDPTSAPRLLLHASSVAIVVGGERRAVEAPTPPGFWPGTTD